MRAFYSNGYLWVLHRGKLYRIGPLLTIRTIGEKTEIAFATEPTVLEDFSLPIAPPEVREFFWL